MGQELQEVGAREHPDRLRSVDDHHGLGPLGEVHNDVVDPVPQPDYGRASSMTSATERETAVTIAKDPVEQPPLVHRTHDVVAGLVGTPACSGPTVIGQVSRD